MPQTRAPRRLYNAPMRSLFDRLRRGSRAAPAPAAQTLHLGALPVEVVRKRVRNYNLRVSAPDGRVRVSAPRWASDASILRMVSERLDWIERHRARLAALPPRDALPPLGAAHRRALQQAIPPLLARWEAALGVKAAAWGVKRMRSRWGSCNPQARRIWLSLELARHPAPCLDYVVLHEVAHLVEPGHGTRFKAILERHMPDWKARRALLRLHPGDPPAASL